MHFEVNGVPFFAKGANWIPADCFPNRLTKDIYRRYINDAVAANMNTLRFWGGGYYEDDDLFDLCDERGICVWLDFKFGCSTYPAFDEAFLKSVAVEARENVLRLRHHPSIAVWCGNNEIMFFRGDKEWTESKMSEGDYYKLFRDTLGQEIGRLAPQSDYVTGSPDCGDVHFWDVWHKNKPFEVYRDIHGFVSEFGFQSFPEPKTVRTFTPPADRQSIYSPAMKYHERGDRMYMDVKEDGRVGTDTIMEPRDKILPRPKGLREHPVAEPDYPGLRHQVRRGRLAPRDAQVDGLRLLAVQRLLARHVVVLRRLLRPLEGPAVHGPAVLRAGARFRGRRPEGPETRCLCHQRPPGELQGQRAVDGNRSDR